MTTEKQESKKQWAIVALLGHRTLAGEISEHTFGGGSFIRIDVPAVNDQPAFTKLLGHGSIYDITFVQEEIARAAAQSYRHAPVTEYEIPSLRQRPMRLTGAGGDDDEYPGADEP